MTTLPVDHCVKVVGAVPTAVDPSFVSWIPGWFMGSLEPVVTSVTVMPLIVAPAGMLNPKFVSFNWSEESFLSTSDSAKSDGVLPTAFEGLFQREFAVAPIVAVPAKPDGVPVCVPGPNVSVFVLALNETPGVFAAAAARAVMGSVVKWLALTDPSASVTLTLAVRPLTSAPL